MALARISFRLLNSSQLIPKTLSLSHTRRIQRWVAPTLREIRKRNNKLGPQPEAPRSSYIDWNYDAEVFAFAKRLNENFDPKKLRQAFVTRSYVHQEKLKQEQLGIHQEDILLEDNTDLINRGDKLIKSYVNLFLKQSLKNLPAAGIDAIQKQITSEENLAFISKNLGTKDLILSAEYPPSTETFSNTLKAIIGALSVSGSEDRSYLFIRDFICTQLNQKDLTEYWHIEKPLELLKQICKERGIDEIEPRIIAEAGTNTVLAAYQVGIFVNKKLIASGYGEKIDIAIDAAALQCLRDVYGVSETMRPISFESIRTHR